MSSSDRIVANYNTMKKTTCVIRTHLGRIYGGLLCRYKSIRYTLGMHYHSLTFSFTFSQDVEMWRRKRFLRFRFNFASLLIPST